MKHLAMLSLFLVFLPAAPVFAAHSTIAEAEGHACLGDDRSRRQTEQAAETEARRRVMETAQSYIESETQIEDFEVKKDLISAYARGTLKNIRVLERVWHRDPAAGDCFRIKISAEVIPEEKAIEKIAGQAKLPADNPAAPLAVRLWTDKKTYAGGEKIRIYLKGNKPFYALVTYRDAGGQILQLLPNPFRRDNYFLGGVIYEIPSGHDRFELEASPPFGEDEIRVYAGTAPLGEIDLQALEGVFRVTTRERDIPEQTRGVKLKEAAGGKGGRRPAEFFEERLRVRTTR